MQPHPPSSSLSPRLPESPDDAGLRPTASPPAGLDRRSSPSDPNSATLPSLESMELSTSAQGWSTSGTDRPMPDESQFFEPATKAEQSQMSSGSQSPTAEQLATRHQTSPHRRPAAHQARDALTGWQTWSVEDVAVSRAESPTKGLRFKGHKAQYFFVGAACPQHLSHCQLNPHDVFRSASSRGLPRSRRATRSVPASAAESLIDAITRFKQFDAAASNVARSNGENYDDGRNGGCEDGANSLPLVAAHNYIGHNYIGHN